jgi:alanyl-tRNA synthetase
MNANEIRASFLRYFEQQGHRIVPSSPLVPSDDPTLLFTNAGMNQFKDVFLGRDQRGYRRAATAQKCMRVSGKHNDLDNVGPSMRHHTFFEMLGNFSFGDYFKAEAIPFAWELLTAEWGLEPRRLYATVFRGEQGIPRDDEAYDVWRQFLPGDHVGELGVGDNFWAMGDTGPCGRCSEIYYDNGDRVPGSGVFMADVESGTGRFVEIWNNVFMEFDRQADGTLRPLPARSIDTGMGLERISAVMKGVLSNYDTELFQPLLSALGRLAGRTYSASMEPGDISMRVIADHIRATTFLIADGVVPSNEWRGYVLRKIMRRAMRHGRTLGLHEPFLHRLVDVLVAEMGHAYPELKGGRDTVVQVVRSEEERFDAVLTGGLPRLEEVLERAARAGRVVPGEEAFRLYDTYGLPRDFIEDLAGAQGLAFDAEGFERALEGQREKARAKSAFGAKELPFVWSGSQDLEWKIQGLGETPFVGYESTRSAATILSLLKLNTSGHTVSVSEVAELREGDEGYAILSVTPFYLESGGQVSDVGSLSTPTGSARVEKVEVRHKNGPRLHRVRVLTGRLESGQSATPAVDDTARDATRRNHTATHLLHAALRTVLGSHVKQAGSLVAPDRLRFDFVHFTPLTADDIEAVERKVNEEIVRNAPVNTAVRDTEEAIAAGAIALFGEKYGDRVRVVSIGDGGLSVELCGGTHVRATGEVGAFVITEESGVAAGVRRIEALTGLGATTFVRTRLNSLNSAVHALNSTPDELGDAIAMHLAAESRLRKEVQQLKTKMVLGTSTRPSEDDRIDINGTTLIARQVTDVDKASLRSLADDLKSRLTSGVVFLAAATADGKVTLVATVTPDLTRTTPAGQLVKTLAPIVGGGGGGRPDFAEAGGKDPSKIADLLAEARRLVQHLLAKASAADNRSGT